MIVFRRLTADRREVVARRLGHLQADSRPRWGRMDARLMVRHLRRALEISLGEVEPADRSVPLLRTALFFLFFHLFTIWPPSRRRLPAEWLPPSARTFAAERELLLEAVDRFVGALAAEPDREAVHTLLGRLTLRSWSRVHFVHFNHHFRQFRLLRY